MMDITPIIGQRIRTQRQMLGLTQEELAEKADLHHTYIGQVERGEKNLTVAALSKILNALHISFSDFFAHISPEPSQQSVASRCYDLIYTMTPDGQEKAYRLLCDINDILSSK